MGAFVLRHPDVQPGEQLLRCGGEEFPAVAGKQVKYRQGG